MEQGREGKRRNWERETAKVDEKVNALSPLLLCR
jgi:hypothetical protein